MTETWNRILNAWIRQNQQGICIRRVHGKYTVRQKDNPRAGEMAPWLRMFSILAEGLGSVFPNLYWAAHYHLKLHSGVPMTSSSLCRHLHAHGLTYTHINENKIFTVVDGRSSLVPRFQQLLPNILATKAELQVKRDRHSTLQTLLKLTCLILKRVGNKVSDLLFLSYNDIVIHSWKV